MRLIFEEGDETRERLNYDWPLKYVGLLFDTIVRKRRINVRRSCRDIIKSDATEGLTSLPPIKSKVTACHAMHGSGSAGNDIREGSAILQVGMDDNNDNFSAECCIGGYIIESNVTEGIPPLPPVDLKGFQHLYTSTKIMSSQRVLAAHKATVKHGVGRNYYARRSDQKKDRKIHDVEKVIPSPHNMMNMRNDTSSKAVFFSGTSERKVPNQVNNSIEKSAITDMRVVDTVENARMHLAPEVNIFLLIPRKAATEKLSNVNKTLASLSALDMAKGFAEKRGKN
jgi:hypothetical protein